MSAPSTPKDQMTSPFNAFPLRIIAPTKFDGYDSNISSPGVCDVEQLSPFMGIPAPIVAPNAPIKANNKRTRDVSDPRVLFETTPFSKLRHNSDIPKRRA